MFSIPDFYSRHADHHIAMGKPNRELARVAEDEILRSTKHATVATQRALTGTRGPDIDLEPLSRFLVTAVAPGLGIRLGAFNVGQSRLGVTNA